ncbi:carboxypeptidase D, b isoform X2 [Pimephales promelas]|uniref:carboxypeptidase D, b isoform X2 n=1 Tax=Pimephales promelas TaxID=90988 RepID=UPI001955A9F2|nr:carboxypeptidase D, b isoform X2 [Pimephales promelas]KAG1970038.1 carboxypeptidase D [Pimephales promelas]
MFANHYKRGAMHILWLILPHILIVPHQTLGLRHTNNVNEETYWGYYNYAAMTDRLQSFSLKYSHICRLASIGQSVEGRELWVMRITTNPSTDEPGKPRFKYVGNIHGDEALSRQVLMYLIEYLLTQYGRDVRVTELVNRTDIYILASMNPDGFERASEGDCTGSAEGRENARHYDLDKSFPDQDKPSSKTLDDTPEVTAVMRWILEKKFVLSGSLRVGSVGASFPFDDDSSSASPGLIADEDLFRHIAQTYIEKHPIMNMDNPDCPGDPNKSFRDGGMQDFNYLKGNCFEVAFKFSCCKYPPASQLYTEWTNNKEALLAYIQKAHIGVRGFVMTRSGFGLPDATISVSGIDHNITSWTFGDYYRLLLPGRYDITASSPGYLSNTVKNVPVIEGKATLLNFTLEKPLEEMLMLGHSERHTKDLSTPGPPSSKYPIQSLEFKYHSYDQMEMMLQLFSAIYPSITSLNSVGRSVQGRNLYVMEISTNPGVDQQGKPEVMFVGNLHGNEFIGREILLNLVEYLCRNYDKDPLVTRLVNSTRIHVMPSMNPDGYEFALKAHKERVSGDQSIIGRSNSHRVDLNANFPEQSQSKNTVEAETQAVINWIKAHSFVLSASIRGGFRGVVYPSSLDSTDENMFKSVAEAFYLQSQAFQEPQACDVSRTRERKRSKQRRPAVTGTDMLTWAYQGTDTLAVSIGLSCELLPPEDSLSEYWEKNHKALLQFIQQVHMFVRGVVTDSQSGKGIANATVVVEGSGHQIRTSRTGQYWRPLAPGSYHLTASAPDYTPMSASVRVLTSRVEQVDFKLTRDALQPSSVEQKDFEKLVEQLLVPGGLDRMVRGLLPAQTLEYRTYKERSEFLRGLTLTFPHITRLYSLGQSTELRTIWALEIAGNLKMSQPAEPKIRFVAGVHGDAAAGPELLLEFASALCLNYRRNLAITKLVDRSRILILPCVNPDGREQALEGVCSSSVGHTNARGIDLDTDFFYGNKSVQPETRSVMDLIYGGGFSLSVVLDGGSLLATYPYDRPIEHEQNEETLRYLASLYANSHPFMHLGNVKCSKKSVTIPGGILKGADFSSHTGSMKDFSLDVGVCPEITVYTGCCLFPPERQLFSMWMENRMPLFRMLLEVHRSLSGFVRDSKGHPVSDAVVMVNGSVTVHADSQGHFTTLVAPGTLQLQVQAHGYQQVLQQVNISSDRVTSPIVIDFTADRAPLSRGVFVIATASLMSILICALLIWHLRSAKFSRIRDGVRWLRRKRGDLQMEAMASEKSPLREEFLDESESEDDPFFVEPR